MTKKDEVLKLLEECSPEVRLEIFRHLRREIPIHSLEAKLNTTAEIILEAIDRGSDLTLRGVRGIITEVAFAVEVVDKTEGIESVPIVGDVSYDSHLRDEIGDVKVQIKMQRRERGKVKVRLGKYVVEVQRTRTGVNKATGEKTRPYRFGEFDILAVSIQPSSNEWDSFMYTVASWLIPRKSDKKLIEIMQPVAREPNEDWTDDLRTSIKWFRSGVKRTIAGF